MSHMRDLESRLRKDTTDIETQIPFWEFLDIEFDGQKKALLSHRSLQTSAHFSGAI
jgi:hypothetical protein